MITTRINVKPHLSEYIRGKYNQSTDEPVRFPDNTDIYHHIFDLTSKRPVRCPIDTGNLEIVLPHPHGSKHPETYNYISARSQRIIQKRLEVMFWAEFRDFIEFEHHSNGTSYIECVLLFIKKYGIKSITEDAMLKNYYRWRKKVRNPAKRAYKQKKLSA